ncbi:hypothetical protein KEU06_03800 [Pseudaminobacter sp. 19-2017]|uniref:Uncharacterized protein n=1 Tax=Pseudaminobacter soli (ex Zhang et al. 2022) TaxID=2831468 RepID=A0A942I830_9HYPH|nr:hypothetical protein [Pseudaminobacter soli]MBS3647751.1 hypothetical protein [Pseudaminobacter soli]
MADFVAVLKKTLEGLSDTTPQTREKVYEKARITISSKLAAMNPPLPEAVMARQKQALEDAIVKVEAEYTPKPSDPLAELESVFESLKNPESRAPLRQPATKAPQPVPPRTPEAPAPQKPAASVPPKPALTASIPEILPATPIQKTLPAPEPLPQLSAPAEDAVTEEPERSDRFEHDRYENQGYETDRYEEFSFATEADDSERLASRLEARRARNSTRRPAISGRLIAAGMAVVLVIGAAAGAWVARDSIGNVLANAGIPGFATPEQFASTPEEPAEAPQEDVAATEPPDDTAEPAAEADNTAPAESDANPASTAPVKFTQRLNADGTETDMGPAGGPPVLGEGTSLAAATAPAMPEPPASAPAEQSQETAAAETTQTPPAADAAEPPAPAQNPPGEAAPQAGQQEASVPVGQRAIFYEERTSVAEASAEPGTIVWSVVQESPGGDLPPEPAIRAEATIPGKDVRLRMTIRRNADQSLPASHIVEMIFLTPQGFEGGGIENVLRMSLKGSEQEAGSPLLGIPAKIADGFFLIALNDSKPEIEANTRLLSSMSWIDVPVQYKSGRRALFTMEKGIPGAKVFDEALKAWQAARSG